MKAEDAQVRKRRDSEKVRACRITQGWRSYHRGFRLEENGPLEIVDCCLVRVAIRSKGSGGSELRIPWTFICLHHVGLLKLNRVQCKSQGIYISRSELAVIEAAVTEVGGLRLPYSFVDVV